MSRVLLASIPVPAHTTNPLPFAARLVERGHEVLWYAGRAFHDRIAAVGAVPLPMTAARDFSGQDLFDAYPQFRGRGGPRVIGEVFDQVFVGEAAGRVVDLRDVVADVDVVLADGLMYGVGLLGELTGTPWATFGDGPLPHEDPDTPPFGPALRPWLGAARPLGRVRNRVVGAVARRALFGPAQRRYDALRAELGLAPFAGSVLEASTSPFLHLQGSVPSFEYPLAALPASVRWVGALRPDPVPGWTPPPWWAEVTSSARPVVHVTQGSLRSDVTELVVPAVRALADRDVLVVVTTGGPSADDVATALGAALPANVRVTPFVPYDELLRHVAVMVTNGGYTGVTLALAHGVPLVQAGSTEEKAEIGARIAWTGVGVRVRSTRPSAATVRAAVDRVLGEPRFAAAARRVQAEMAPLDAGRLGADALEELAISRSRA